MSSAPKVRSGQDPIVVWKRRAATNAPAAPASRQPAVAKGARETAREKRRQNVAGAPYYRGLNWDY